MGDVLRIADHRATADRVASVLAAGGTAVFPTDTVYGIAQAVAANPDGALKLFAVKRRPLHKTIPWLVADGADLDRYGRAVPPWAHRLAETLWPGGLTLVVAASPEVPPAYRGPGDTVALRVPNAPLVRDLAVACSSPLATTSANTSGAPAPASFAALEPRIVREADVVVDGGVAQAGLSSTVVLCTGERPVVTREGAIPCAQIDRIAGVCDQ